MLGRVDVLTLPVDGSEHILSFKQADEIVERLKPKVVIPTHYLQKGFSSTLTTLQVADTWVDGQPRKRKLTEPRLVFTADGIKDYDREFFYFRRHSTSRLARFMLDASVAAKGNMRFSAAITPSRGSVDKGCIIRCWRGQHLESHQS